MIILANQHVEIPKALGIHHKEPHMRSPIIQENSFTCVSSRYGSALHGIATYCNHQTMHHWAVFNRHAHRVGFAVDL